MASLFGKLREHELEMNRLNVQESENKHVRSIALKAVKHKGKQQSSDEESLSLLSRKFSKFLKRNRNKDNNKERYGNKKSNDFNSNNYTCFGWCLNSCLCKKSKEIGGTESSDQVLGRKILTLKLNQCSVSVQRLSTVKRGFLITKHMAH